MRFSIALFLLITFGFSYFISINAQALAVCKYKPVVAVIDTGIDPTHPDIKDHLWRDKKNPSIYGWDMINNRPNPTDFHGHGTHIAGIILKVNPCAEIMPIKYYSDAQTGTENFNKSIAALNYAINRNVDIINYSGGGPDENSIELEAIIRANAKGILIVAAAGNERENIDEKNHYYPASYGLPNIISVNNVDAYGNISPFSNWGPKTVDIAAPGENILSTIPTFFGQKKAYGHQSGTSQATAHVSGAASLILANRGRMPIQPLKDLILKSVRKDRKLANKNKTGGVIDVDKLLRFIR